MYVYIYIYIYIYIYENARVARNVYVCVYGGVPLVGEWGGGGVVGGGSLKVPMLPIL